ncbi:MAG: DUF1570 domain-containing protein [Planctomycetota bacterium]
MNRWMLGLPFMVMLCLACAAWAGDDEAGKAKKPDTKKAPDLTELPTDDKAVAEELKKLGKDFKAFHTAHFAVLHNVNDKDVRAFSAAIEKTYRSNLNYTLSLDIDPKKPSKKLIIYYFAQHPNYSDYSKTLGKGERPQSQPGVFFPDLNRSMFYDFRNQDSFKKVREEAEAKIVELKKQLQGKVTPESRKGINQQIKEAQAHANASGVQGGDHTEETVQHEVTHHVLWNVGLHNPKSFFANPRWYAEGTAMMFETAGTGKASNIGAVNKKRLADFRVLEKAGKLKDLKEFVSHPELFNNPATVADAYSQAWALAHYLNRTKRPRIKGFVEAINARPEGFEAGPDKDLAVFEKAFGKLDEKWTRQWKDWMKNVR